MVSIKAVTRVSDQLQYYKDEYMHGFDEDDYVKMIAVEERVCELSDTYQAMIKQSITV